MLAHLALGPGGDWLRRWPAVLALGSLCVVRGSARTLQVIERAQGDADSSCSAGPSRSRLRLRRGGRLAFRRAGIPWSRVHLLPVRLGEYRALGPELEAFGPAQVSIVGSSRAREGLLLPLLHRHLEREPGAAPSVASYAIGGARAAEVELVVRKLLAADAPPDLIVYGLTPAPASRQEAAPGTRPISGTSPAGGRSGGCAAA